MEKWKRAQPEHIIAEKEAFDTEMKRLNGNKGILENDIEVLNRQKKVLDSVIELLIREKEAFESEIAQLNGNKETLKNEIQSLSGQKNEDQSLDYLSDASSAEMDKRNELYLSAELLYKQTSNKGKLTYCGEPSHSDLPPSPSTDPGTHPVSPPTGG